MLRIGRNYTFLMLRSKIIPTSQIQNFRYDTGVRVINILMNTGRKEYTVYWMVNCKQSREEVGEVINTAEAVLALVRDRGQ